MTEFAITLPVLLLLLFGITEIGRAIIRYNTLTKTAQDGVRYAAAYALLGTTGAVNIDAQLLAATRNVVVYGNTAGTGQALLRGLAPAQVQLVDLGGDQLRLDVSYTYVPLVGTILPDFGLGGAFNTGFVMQTSVSMRAL